MTKQVHTEKQTQDIQIFYNNDVRIIDYLSDLHDREPILSLDRYVRFSGRNTICLLFNCKEDNLFVLLLYNAPFLGNEDGNRLSLYAHKNLRILCTYFKSWLDSQNGIPNANKESLKALEDIVALLFYQWAVLQDNDTQSDFLG